MTQITITGKYADVLTPFVILMAHELHANAGKGDRPGWLQMDPNTAQLEIYYHMGKLARAVRKSDEPGIREYAADVANMCLMLVDVCGLLNVGTVESDGYTRVWAEELAELRERAALPVQIEKGEVWYWQGDGHDFPESLVCPVIMQAKTLRELIAARQPNAGDWQDDYAAMEAAWPTGAPPAPAAVPVDAIEAARSAYKAVKVYSTGETSTGEVIRSVADMNRNDDAAWRAAINAALMATHPQPAAAPVVEFDRARETPRRQTAVELLLSMGYVWRNDHWELGEHTELATRVAELAGAIMDNTKFNVVSVPASTIHSLAHDICELIRTRPAVTWDEQAYMQASTAAAEWQRRALDAEETLSRLHQQLNEENGPTNLGEPVFPRPKVSPTQLRQAADAYVIGSVAYLNGCGLSGDDDPSVSQLLGSATAGMRAALQSVGMTIVEEAPKS